MISVSDQGLRVEDVAADEFADCHGEIGDQANSGDSDTRVMGVGGCEVGIAVVMVVVVVAGVAVMSGLRGHR